MNGRWWLPTVGVAWLALAGASGFAEDAVDRLAPDRLAATREAIERLRGERRACESSRPWRDLRANLHVHSAFSHDSRGTVEEITAAAKKVGTQVVMFTEHPADHYDYFRDGHRGMRDGVLLIPGAETKGLLVFPRHSLQGVESETPQGYSSLVRGRGGLSFVSHLEERMDWALTGVTGVEIYNTHADFKGERRLVKSLANPWWLLQAADVFRRYPQEAFSALQDYPADYLRRWDELQAVAPHVGVSANDAHQNVGIVIRMGDAGKPMLEDGGGKKLLDLEPLLIAPWVKTPADAKPGDVLFDWKMDPYESSLRHVATHLLASDLTEAAVWESLEQGRAYVAFDWLADATSFDARIEQNGQRREMGSRAAWSEGTRLLGCAPLSAQWRLYRNGRLEHECKGRTFDLLLKRAGRYRVELWLVVADQPRPWILSNPFYLVE